MHKDKKLTFTGHKDGVHLWESTTSPTVQRCGRAGCTAMRQYVNGAWVEPQARKPQTTISQAEQAQLWA